MNKNYLILAGAAVGGYLLWKKYGASAAPAPETVPETAPADGPPNPYTANVGSDVYGPPNPYTDNVVKPPNVPYQADGGAPVTPVAPPNPPVATQIQNPYTSIAKAGTAKNVDPMLPSQYGPYIGGYQFPPGESGQVVPQNVEPDMPPPVFGYRLPGTKAIA